MASVPTKARHYQVPAVDRAISILEHLKDKEQGLSITELSRELGITKSVVYNILYTLLERGYVAKAEESGKFLLGLGIVRLSRNILARMTLVQVARPIIDQLVAESKESCNLAVLDGDKAVTVFSMDGPLPLRRHIKVGEINSFNTTAVGKVLLAWLDSELRERILEGIVIEPHTRFSITGHDELRCHLAEVRAKGYAVDDEENEEGGRCIAAPIFGVDGSIVAALSISGPSTRVTKDRIEEFARMVMTAAREISKHFAL